MKKYIAASVSISCLVALAILQIITIAHQDVKNKQHTQNLQIEYEKIKKENLHLKDSLSICSYCPK